MDRTIFKENIVNKIIKSILLLGVLSTPVHASLLTVGEIAPSSGNLDVWMYGDMRDGGTANVSSVSGLGGNLEANAPLGNDAVKLTTGANNNDKAEIVLNNDFGQVQAIFNSNLSISYDYYRENQAGLNTFAAPSLKLGFYNGNCAPGDDCYFQLIYEPYQNSSLVDSDWTSINLDLNFGMLWNTGGFGLASGGGGCPCLSLADTLAATNFNFQEASLVSIALGLGTYNQGVTGYIDNVSINTDSYSNTFDFERTEVPEPTTIAIAALGLLGLARRKVK